MYVGLHLYLDVEDPGFNTSISLLKGRFSPLLRRCCSGQATKLFFSTSLSGLDTLATVWWNVEFQWPWEEPNPALFLYHGLYFAMIQLPLPLHCFLGQACGLDHLKKRTFTQDIYYTKLVCVVTRFVQNSGVLVLEGLINRERMSWIHENCEQYCFFFFVLSRCH